METHSFLPVQTKMLSSQSGWTDKSRSPFCIPWIPKIRLEEAEGLVRVEGSEQIVIYLANPLEHHRFLRVQNPEEQLEFLFFVRGLGI